MRCGIIHKFSLYYSENSKLIVFQEYINFLSIQDPTEVTPSGFQQADSISVWSRTGKKLFTADKYMDLVEVFEPDLYVALCDGNLHNSEKRLSKAMDRSKILTEQCLKRHAASNKLKSKSILGAVEGGYNLKVREESVEYLKNKPFAGYVIDGLHDNGPDVKNIKWEQIENVIQHTIVSQILYNYYFDYFTLYVVSLFKI